MKKTKLPLLLTALICLFSLQQSKAQISSISVTGFDSLMTYCVLPNTDNFFVYGTVVGTVAATDSTLVNVNFGDGYIATEKVKIYPYSSGSGGYFNKNFAHTYTLPGTFSPFVKASLPTGLADSFTATSFTLSNSCGTLKGQLYVDDNSNCVKDVAENGVYWTPILVVNTATSDTTIGTWSNDTGFYAIELLPGTYTIIPNAVPIGSYGAWVDSNLTASCPSTGAYSLTVSPGGSYTKDFAYTCKTITSYDASVVTGARCFVPGDSTYIYIWAGSWAWYYHYSCMSLSTTVTLTLDSKLSYLSSSYGLAPSSISGSTITWNLSSTADVTRFYAGIWVKTSTSATIGDTIKNIAYIAPTALTDPNLANNTHNYAKVVSSSYDPNVKEVAPAGYGTKGYIANGQQLTYTIHFQNTGTAAAKNVTIVDEIDDNLDIKSLHLLNATHNANMYVDGKTVKFRFEGINLPDSGANFEGSMGAITYGIMPKAGLAPATEMTNTAGIYFDYNAPIITNTTLNTIEVPTNIQNVSLGNLKAQIFPNPANNSLNVSMDSKDAFTVRMLDLLGRTLTTGHSNNGALTLPTQALPEGTYLINIKNEQGAELNTKVTIKH